MDQKSWRVPNNFFSTHRFDKYSCCPNGNTYKSVTLLSGNQFGWGSASPNKKATCENCKWLSEAEGTGLYRGHLATR